MALSPGFGIVFAPSIILVFVPGLDLIPEDVLAVAKTTQDRGTPDFPEGTSSSDDPRRTAEAPMQSKLTLRLDADVKERAKRLAEERGTSVSTLVEQYFRLLLREPTDDEGEDRDDAPSPATTDSGASLSPRIQELKQQLGRPAPDVSIDEDTRRWIEAAAEKHG